MISYFYLKIYIFIRRKKSKLTHNYKMFKTTISLFASFFLFSLCWIPYVIAMGFEDNFSMSIHVLVTFMAHINSTMNPIFYMVLNPGFFRSARKFKKKIMRSMSSYQSSIHQNQALLCVK